MVAVVVVAQGAELSILKKMAPRCLPWWNKAFAAGHLWPMACGPAPYEPSNLTSAFTGVGRGSHGCYSYWNIRSDENGPGRVLESGDVLAPRIWAWPSLSDLRFGVINIQLTHPPEPLNGFMLSYLMKQTLRYAYPNDLIHNLARRGLRYGHDVSVFHRGEPAAHFFRETMRVAEYQLEAALALASSVDVLIFNLTLLDRLSHFLWTNLDEASAADNPYLLQGYQFVDEALSKLDACCSSAPLMVLSEVGFGELEKFVSLDDALRAGGFQKVGQNGEIDETRSLAREAVQGSHGIILLGGARADKHVVDEVGCCLLEARENNRPLVKAVLNKEAIYTGGAVHLAPDLIVEPADPARPPLGDPRWARHVNRNLQTGWHRDSGFLLTLRAREVMAAGTEIRPECIAATLAAIIGRDPPDGLEGPPVACRAT